jgi:hypothetical protein
MEGPKMVVDHKSRMLVGCGDGRGACGKGGDQGVACGSWQSQRGQTRHEANGNIDPSPTAPYPLESLLRLGFNFFSFLNDML